MRQREQGRDPLIREAKRRMACAAESYNAGLAEARGYLLAAMEVLAEHPEYASAAALRATAGDDSTDPRRHTPAWWLYMTASQAEKGYPGCQMNPLEFADDILRDVHGGAEKMRLEAIRDEARIAKIRARRERAREQSERKITRALREVAR